MFSITLEKEQLIFSAAHFITFADAEGATICESLHGHNFRVASRVEGELDEHGLVIDFIWLRDALRAITSRLDHHVLLAEHHPDIQIERGSGEVTARFGDRRWVFPADEVALLPLENTTAEALARYLGEQLLDDLSRASGSTRRLTSLTVSVDENEGQWANWRHEFKGT